MFKYIKNVSVLETIQLTKNLNYFEKLYQNKIKNYVYKITPYIDHILIDKSTNNLNEKILYKTFSSWNVLYLLYLMSKNSNETQIINFINSLYSKVPLKQYYSIVDPNSNDIDEFYTMFFKYISLLYAKTIQNNNLYNKMLMLIYYPVTYAGKVIDFFIEKLKGLEPLNNFGNKETELDEIMYNFYSLYTEPNVNYSFSDLNYESLWKFWVLYSSNIVDCYTYFNNQLEYIEVFTKQDVDNILLLLLLIELLKNNEFLVKIFK